MKIIYRDLKPENVLMCADGNVKLCDFGLAAVGMTAPATHTSASGRPVLIDRRGFIKLTDFGFAKKILDRTYTRCGTPDYASPEMMLGEGVNRAADWWSLGVLTFELLVGELPFTETSAKDELRTYVNILKGAVAYPEDAQVDATARDFVGGLLQVKVPQRLGYRQRGAVEVLEHEWFKGMDWGALVNLRMAPPWRPDSRAISEGVYFEDSARDLQNAIPGAFPVHPHRPQQPQDPSPTLSRTGASPIGFKASVNPPAIPSPPGGAGGRSEAADPRAGMWSAANRAEKDGASSVRKRLGGAGGANDKHAHVWEAFARG